MSYGRILLATGLACACANATATGPASYSCDDPPIRRLAVDLDYSERLRAFNAARDPGERKQIAERLRATAKTPTELDMAKFVGASILIADKKYAEAEQSYAEIAASRVVARGNSDAARIALANLAIDRKDYDGALAWLEPMVTAGCKTVEDGARRALAYLYQEKGRLADALEQIDKVRYRGQEDADYWRAVRIDFRCVLEGEMTCARQIACLARNGELGVKSFSAANRHLTRMRDSEAGQAALACAKDYGAFDDQGQLVNNKVEQVFPIKRPTPVYPREAVRRGISGYVDLAFVINPDGTVKSVEVWDSRPMKVFDQAALAAARRNIFKPKIVDGQPVEASGLQRYEFIMKN